MTTRLATGSCALLLSLVLVSCSSSSDDSADEPSASGGDDATEETVDPAGEDTSDATADDGDSDSPDAPTEAGMDEAFSAVGIATNDIALDDNGWEIDIPADQGDPAAYSESTCVNARLYISATDPDASSGVAREVEVTVDGEAAFTWSGDFADQCVAAG